MIRPTNILHDQRHAGLNAVLPAIWAITSLAAAAAPARWAEGEHYFRQFGSVRVDLPPYGSGGECLGSNWGGGKGHFVEYRFFVEARLDDAVLFFRYARQFAPSAHFSFAVDDRSTADVVFTSTGGWGHRADSEWRFLRVPLGEIESGWHTLRLESTADKNNANLDGFFLADSTFAPPNRRNDLERAPRLRLLRGDRGAMVDEEMDIETFSPVEEDRYYPAEENEQRRQLKPPEILRWQGEGALVREDSAGGGRPVKPGDKVGDWFVVARLTGPDALVVERRLQEWGLFLYLDRDGVAAGIRKSVGRIDGMVGPPRKYPAGYMEWVCDSAADVLGERALSLGEPSFRTVAGWLPELTGYTVIGDRGNGDKLVVDADGVVGVITERYGVQRIGVPLFDPAKTVSSVHFTHAKRGLLGGFLPAVDYGFADETRQRGWEEIAFVTERGAWVGICDGNDWRAFRLDPLTEVPMAALFHELLSLHRRWRAFALRAMSADLPEQRLVDASLAGLVRTRLTYDGSRPKYGVGVYAGNQHDAFPPTTLWTVAAELEWGLLDQAREDLEHYLDHFVRPDGTFDYYGPAVSEYGMMLERAARFVRYTGDAQWLTAHRAVIERICRHLLNLRHASLARDDVPLVARGLLFGSAEADTHKVVAYYYSGSMWAWRGLVEWGRLLQDTGVDAAGGAALLQEAAALRTDIERSLQLTLTDDMRASGFIPPHPGVRVPFTSMTENRLASYTNYRYWLEMLSAGFLARAPAEKLIAFRRRHGGECLGMTRFMSHLDDWPLAGYAYALLALDHVDQYLLVLYGHLAHHQMRGTFSDFEQVDIRDVAERTYRADYCVPAQLTVPLMARWMLVFGEREADTLWLCRAAPARWFAAGERWGVTGAPTRWGKVSFDVATTEARIVVSVTPPERTADTIAVRVRLPEGRRPSRVQITGCPGAYDAANSAVMLRRPSQRCQVVIER